MLGVSDRGVVSPARGFGARVLDFLEVGRGKTSSSSSSSSSSLGISGLMEPLGPLSFVALEPAWSLTRARVELMADFQRARGLKFSRKPGRSVSADGVWTVSHYGSHQFHGGQIGKRTRTLSARAAVAVGRKVGSGFSKYLIKLLAGLFKQRYELYGKVWWAR